MMIEWTEPRLIKLSERKAAGQCENGASNSDCWDGNSASAECDMGYSGGA